MLRGFFRRITQLFSGRGRIDEAFLAELEETLIEGDVGVRTAMNLVERLRVDARSEGLSTPEQVRDRLIAAVAELMRDERSELRLPAEPPGLILVVGVNGTGKTTTIAKLAHWLQGRGKRVLLAAGDTFRAAAIDQLALWAQRLGAEIVRHHEGADPAAVIYDAIAAARARGYDVVIADTAGRLHTRTNLMEELKKIHRVAERALGRPADEVLLVLDATVGQNSVNQARAFGEALPLTGIVLAKMDGTARGGVIVTVKDELGLPIKFVGTGEKPDRLAPFDAQRFAASLFADDAPG